MASVALVLSICFPFLHRFACFVGLKKKYQFAKKVLFSLSFVLTPFLFTLRYPWGKRGAHLFCSQNSCIGFYTFLHHFPISKEVCRKKIHTKWVSLISIFCLEIQSILFIFPVFVCLDTTFYCSEYLDAIGRGRNQINSGREREKG